MTYSKLLTKHGANFGLSDSSDTKPWHQQRLKISEIKITPGNEIEFERNKKSVIAIPKNPNHSKPKNARRIKTQFLNSHENPQK